METFVADPLEEARDALAGLRDTIRSVRRWRELLSDADRHIILSDIARVGLAVARDLSTDANDLDIGNAPHPNAPCPVERLGFLKAVLPQVLAALLRIEKEPPAALRTAERTVALGRARRISAAALRQVAQKLHLLSHAPRIAETIAVPTYDTPAVRAAKTIAVTFARDLAAIAAIAQENGYDAIFADAERLRLRLQAALRRPTWRDLPLLPRVPLLSPTLRRSGAHRLLYDIYGRYRSGFAWDWSSPLFRLPARETWILYEYWCFFAVINAVRGLGFRASGEDSLVRTALNGISLTLAINKRSTVVLRRGGDTVVVNYQRRFVRGESGSLGFHSRGQTLIPDITVEYDNRLLILDAKFKTYAEPGAETEDIRQLHAYRDALRRAEVHPVQASWALYAGSVSKPNRPTLSYPAYTPARPFGNGEVGAVLLRPGLSEDTLLRQLLETFFREVV